MSKSTLSPASEQIASLMKAIQSDDPKSAHLLLQKVFEVANTAGETRFLPIDISAAEIGALIPLIKGINPQDTVEMVLA